MVSLYDLTLHANCSCDCDRAFLVSINDCSCFVFVNADWAEFSCEVFKRLSGDIPHLLLVESWTCSLSVVYIICHMVHGSKPWQHHIPHDKSAHEERLNLSSWCSDNVCCSSWCSTLMQTQHTPVVCCICLLHLKPYKNVPLYFRL